MLTSHSFYLKMLQSNFVINYRQSVWKHCRRNTNYSTAKIEINLTPDTFLKIWANEKFDITYWVFPRSKCFKFLSKICCKISSNLTIIFLAIQGWKTFRFFKSKINSLWIFAHHFVLGLFELSIISINVSSFLGFQPPFLFKQIGNKITATII